MFLLHIVPSLAKAYYPRDPAEGKTNFPIIHHKPLGTWKIPIPHLTSIFRPPLIDSHSQNPQNSPTIPAVLLNQIDQIWPQSESDLGILVFPKSLSPLSPFWSWRRNGLSMPLSTEFSRPFVLKVESLKQQKLRIRKHIQNSLSETIYTLYISVQNGKPFMGFCGGIFSRKLRRLGENVVSH